MAFKEEIYNNFINNFSNILREKTGNIEISKLIFLCIGTDRITGDSFGPLVGYKLKRLLGDEENIEVFGSLDKTISMQNIMEIINYIDNTYNNPFIIAIDAALSNKKDIGRIVVSKEKMNIGSCFKNKKIYAR